MNCPKCGFKLSLHDVIDANEKKMHLACPNCKRLVYYEEKVISNE